MDNLFIQKTRKGLGLSKSFVSRKLDLSRSTYDKVERGTKSLTYNQLEQLASLFNMPVDNLIKKEEYVTKINIIKDKDEGIKNEMRINVPQKNIKKMKEVLLYILIKVGNKPNVGETVINKLLYFIDFDYYEKYGKQLTGSTYIKNHFGPTPCELKQVVEQMSKDKEILILTNKVFDFQQKKYIPLREPNLEYLNAQEFVHINEVLARLSNKNAKEISEYSHGDIPWRMFKDGEKIDYESVFYRDDNYSVKEYDDELDSNTKKGKIKKQII